MSGIIARLPPEREEDDFEEYWGDAPEYNTHERSPDDEYNTDASASGPTFEEDAISREWKERFWAASCNKSLGLPPPNPRQRPLFYRMSKSDDGVLAVGINNRRNTLYMPISLPGRTITKLSTGERVSIPAIEIDYWMHPDHILPYRGSSVEENAKIFLASLDIKPIVTMKCGKTPEAGIDFMSRAVMDQARDWRKRELSSMLEQSRGPRTQPFHNYPPHHSSGSFGSRASAHPPMFYEGRRGPPRVSTTSSFGTTPIPLHTFSRSGVSTTVAYSVEFD